MFDSILSLLFWFQYKHALAVCVPQLSRATACSTGAAAVLHAQLIVLP
jgi:hypothetical protein